MDASSSSQDDASSSSSQDDASSSSSQDDASSSSFQDDASSSSSSQMDSSSSSEDDASPSSSSQNDASFSSPKYNASSSSSEDDTSSSTSLSLSSFPSTASPWGPLKRKQPMATSTSWHAPKRNQPMVASKAFQSSDTFCNICIETKSKSDMFLNTTICSHVYCSDCICKHISAKIKDNITKVKCPHPECNGEIGPEHCRTIIPKEVLERWEDALCESLILGTQKIYCPFKDCSAMLVDDGGKAVTSSECPNCNRLFCAQCKVAWHSGMDCNEFKNLKSDERNPEDIMVMQLAKNKNWRRCPNCNYFVERNGGCLHILCRCGYEFCYGCGKKYHKSHACNPRTRDI
ncbi:hypothetical protein LXL04_032268 [Taraxacum kok-saghyz]